MLKGNLLFLRLVSAMAIGLALASSPAFSYAATGSALTLPPAGMGSIVLVNLDGGNETLTVNFGGTIFTVPPQGGVSPNQVEFNLPTGTYSYTASVAGIGSITNSITVVAGRVLSLAFSDNLADLANGDQNGDDQSVITTQVISTDNDDENAESDDNNENESEQANEENRVVNNEGDENNESAEAENVENDSNFRDDRAQIEAGKFFNNGKFFDNGKFFGNGQFGHFPFNGFNNGKGSNLPLDAGKSNGSTVNPGQAKNFTFNTGKPNGNTFNNGRVNNFTSNTGKSNSNTFKFNSGKGNNGTFNACTNNMFNPACGFNNGGGSQGKGNSGKKSDILTVSYTPDVSGPALTVANDGRHDDDDNNGDDEGSEQVVRTVTTPVFDNDELLVTVTDVTALAQ